MGAGEALAVRRVVRRRVVRFRSFILVIRSA
jgi:hypothetical protein